MPSLYSYCIPYDDGAAPNPFWGVCTLVICKPAIRRTAQLGDWIVGTGSRHARLADGTTRDLTGRVVYAMEVTKKMTMAEYDTYAKSKLAKKIPDLDSPDPRRWVGDSIYDYALGWPAQRKGVHTAANRDTDLGGENALLSTHFYYFGDKALPLKGKLVDIAQNRQGHRRKLNDPYLEKFVDWIENLGHKACELVGEPLCNPAVQKSACGWCAAGRAEDDEVDVEETVAPSHPSVDSRRARG